jgi:hypothetical protein
MGMIEGVVLTLAIFVYMHVLAGSNSPKLSNVWIETESDANRGESGIARLDVADEFLD